MTPLLVQRRKSVDRAFERLYRRHVHDVYRYTLAVLHNEADAEDVTQATFLNAYRAFRDGEQLVKPHNWLIKIAHNECRQRFRASARRPQEVALQETDGRAAAGPDDDVPSAEELRHALAQLSFNQRAALVMRELEGRTYAEIATILETSVSAVETLLFRARRALREQLEGGLTCGQAELTLARRLEGTITPSERGPLRAHLRECKECAALERRQRAHRTALKTTLGTVPLPASLQSFFGGGAATMGGGVAIAGSGVAGKVVAVVAAGAVAVGAGQAVDAVTTKPDTRKAEHVLDGAHHARATFSPVTRVRRAAPTSARRYTKTRKAQARTAALDPAGKGAAHRRSLRPSDVEPSSDEASAAPVRANEGPASTPTPPASPVAQPPAIEPAPLETLPLPLPPPPPVEIPKLPPLPPPPPPPPPSSCRSCRRLLRSRLLRSRRHRSRRHRSRLCRRRHSFRKSSSYAFSGGQQVLGRRGIYPTMTPLLAQARRRRRERALSCHEAERAVSRRFDGRLARREHKPLRRHLRECPDCAHFARSRQMQRSAWKTLANVPLPPSLRSFSGAGGANGPGLHALSAAAKTLAVVAIGAGGVGVLYDGVGRPASTTTIVPAPARQAPIRAKAAPRPKPSTRPRFVQRRPAREAVAHPIAARPQRATPPVERSATRKVLRARTVPIRARPRPKPAAPVRIATASPPAPQPPPSVPAETPTPPTAPPPPPPQPPALPQLPPVPPLPVPLPLPLPPPPQLP